MEGKKKSPSEGDILNVRNKWYPPGRAFETIRESLRKGRKKSEVEKRRGTRNYNAKKRNRKRSVHVGGTGPEEKSGTSRGRGKQERDRGGGVSFTRFGQLEIRTLLGDGTHVKRT